ncbi:unnamed protein product [Ixodes persulcatus]
MPLLSFFIWIRSLVLSETESGSCTTPLDDDSMTKSSFLTTSLPTTLSKTAFRKASPLMVSFSLSLFHTTTRHFSKAVSVLQTPNHSGESKNSCLSTICSPRPF